MKKLLLKGFGFIKRNIGAFFETIKYYTLFPFAFLFYGKRKIYLVAERGVDARDNGYHFYRYLKECHPDLESYYVIDKKSADYPKVASLGNIVQYKSLRHYLLFIAAKYKISTHIMGFSPNTLFYTSFNIKHRLKGKLVFLQHGVIKDNLVGLYQDQTKVDVFICGAKPEYEYVSSTFHYKNNEVCYTGLARYDALYDVKLKRQILVMPTWRVYLKTLSKNELLQSTYFCAWNTFLSDERLIRFLEKQNVELVFYPHFEMQPYISHFKASSKRIKVATFENYDVQTLLKESLLLITDYSSVFFDFGYMQKPCIYYQFDQEEFVKKHYSRGYFDYEQNGFGPVTKDLAELMSALETVENHQFQMEEYYQKRSEQFFPLKDQNNCERIFQEIEKL